MDSMIYSLFENIDIIILGTFTLSKITKVASMIIVLVTIFLIHSSS